MKCKHSIGNCHIWGSEQQMEKESDVLTCDSCNHSSGLKTIKERFESLRVWALKCYRDPPDAGGNLDHQKGYYIGFAHGIKLIQVIMGDDFDVYDRSDELKTYVDVLRHFGFNAPDFIPEEFSNACRVIWEDLDRMVNDSLQGSKIK